MIARESRRISRLLIAAAVMVALVVAGVGGAAGSAKPEPTVIPDGYSHRIAHLKFREGTAVRVREGKLTSLEDDNLARVREVLDRYPGVAIARLFNSSTERALTGQQQRIERESGRELADLNLYFRLRFPAETDETALIEDLNALGIVETAYPEPLPAPPPVTPDFTSLQGYLQPAPTGIDSAFAFGIAGGRGQNVKIIDIEYSWNQTHEDLTRANGALIPNGTYADPFPSDNGNHGTAVLGEMIADSNAFGVTGAADLAGIGMVNSYNTTGYRLEDAIDVAHANLTDGDVIIIEQQISGPNGCNNGVSGCVAVEWVQAYYDAILSATLDGIIVLEAAGNGNENLDDTVTYGNPFPAGRADSGAIIVGAANYPGCSSPSHGRSSFSTYGARVNLHAYGQCVATTGYGTLQNDPGLNADYSNSFGGTSGATPIVTSAAAILSSVAQAQGDVNGLSSIEARTLLSAGATPQSFGIAGNVGPMPNLAAILNPSPPTIGATNPASGANNNAPLISGAAPVGSTVKLYTTADCSGAPAATGSAAQFASPGLTVNVADNSTTQIRATATYLVSSTSACSAPITYVESSTPPSAPVLASTSPASPANDNNPEIVGSAPAGTTIDLYETNNCSGPIEATGTAAQLASPGLTASVLDNTTSPFSATATNVSTSVCSNSISFVESTPPPDSDGDGIADAADQCDANRGPAPTGCPTFRRLLTIAHPAAAFTGRLGAALAACKRQTVRVFQRDPGPDTLVGRDQTNARGRYSVPEPNADGRYYTKATRKRVAGVGFCGAVSSRVLGVG